MMLQAPTNDRKTQTKPHSPASPKTAEQLPEQQNNLAALQKTYGNQAVLRMIGRSPAANPVQGVLQRKCACGNTAGSSGSCAECQSKQEGILQTKLQIGEVGDRYEQEADRVADQVMAAPAHSVISGAPPRIQRFTGQAIEGADTAPASVGQTLASPGSPLEPLLQQDMEQRFSHDFSRVRVHSDAAAEQSAQEVNANAYTVGHDIVFGAGQFAPNTDSGRRLLAHELVHVVQQRAPILRAKPKQKAPLTPKIPQICDRNSRKVSGNSITKVNLDVGANTLTIEWQDKTKIPPGGGGTHKISPGAGLCCVDCNDEKVSQTTGSLCTPKGSEWPVANTRCALSGHPTAKNPTFFQRGGIAIHSGNTGNPPQSHGCSRTSKEISELIHDNVVNEQTMIASSGTWAGTKCYLKEASDVLSNRKDVCDGNKLKSKNENKKAKKKLNQNNKANAPAEMPTEQTPKPAQSPIRVAEEFPVESNELATVEEFEPSIDGQSEMLADGPGPNNEPPSNESIDEVPIADLDPVQETGEIEEETATV